MNGNCTFCDIANGARSASIVCADELTMAFIDIRQFHSGHTLVIPRRHVGDIRHLDETTGAAVMATLIRVTRAVDAAFPNDGMSLWHSIGPAAFQEVPHAHFHIQPRKTADGFLRVYPHTPPPPAEEVTRDEFAARIRLFR